MREREREMIDRCYKDFTHTIMEVKPFHGAETLVVYF
jgi:hypothetical protein